MNIRATRRIMISVLVLMMEPIRPSITPSTPDGTHLAKAKVAGVVTNELAKLLRKIAFTPKYHFA